LEAKPSACRQLYAAGAAGKRELGAAAEAEPGVDRVLLLAPETLHVAGRLQLAERAGPSVFVERVGRP
jgi:hypothetical protein